MKNNPNMNRAYVKFELRRCLLFQNSKYFLIRLAELFILFRQNGLHCKRNLKEALKIWKKQELNSCRKKFYVSCRKQDGSHYKKTSIKAIRAAVDRFLRDKHKKTFSIVTDS